MHIYTGISLQSLKDRRCTLRVSFLEVYKDELIDLMETEVPKDISIREDPSGNTCWELILIT